MIYVPQRDHTYTVDKTNGALRDGEQIRCSHVNDIKDALVAPVLTSHFDTEQMERTVDTIRTASLSGVRGVRIIVSESLELGLIAEGVLEANWCVKCDPFGAAAGRLLIEHAGGRVTQMDGAPFDIHSPTILATNGKLHDQIVRLLKPYAHATL